VKRRCRTDLGKETVHGKRGEKHYGKHEKMESKDVCPEQVANGGRQRDSQATAKGLRKGRSDTMQKVPRIRNGKKLTKKCNGGVYHPGSKDHEKGKKGNCRKRVKSVRTETEKKNIVGRKLQSKGGRGAFVAVGNTTAAAGGGGPGGKTKAPLGGSLSGGRGAEEGLPMERGEQPLGGGGHQKPKSFLGTGPSTTGNQRQKSVGEKRQGRY